MPMKYPVFTLTAFVVVYSAVTCATMLQAGVVKALPDEVRCPVSNVDDYDIKPLLEGIKKLNAWCDAQLEDRGVKAVAQILKEYKSLRDKLIADFLTGFEAKRKQEYAEKLRLVKAAQGRIRAGRADLWAAGRFDNATVLVTADPAKWLYESDEPFIEINKRGTGRGTRHESKITKQDNGVSVWAQVRGPDFTNIDSGHSWWTWQTKVTYRPTMATIQPRVNADKVQLELRLIREVGKLTIF